MKVMVFCVVGGHSVEVPTIEDLPEGWSQVKASPLPFPSGPSDPWSPAIWYEDPNSDATVLCCPQHDVVRI